MKNLKDVQSLIKDLSKKIELPIGVVLSVGDTQRDDATPYLEIKDDDFHYISRERGVELFRNVTSNLDELRYWFFEDVVSELSFDYEFNNRVKGKDSRRLAFSKKQSFFIVLIHCGLKDGMLR
ncbi:MAG: immunity 63 family protein [Agarilytica sp.]